jgi:sulfonate transport system substrate-binding protein
MRSTRTRSRHRQLAAGLLAAATVLATAACGSDPEAQAGESADPTTVRVGVLNGSDTGLALARTTGALEDELEAVDAQVEYAGPFPAFVPAAEAIKAGAVDVTIGGLLSWVGGVAANPDLVVFAKQATQQVNEGIVATGASGIATLADLEGKKIAINKAGTGEYLLLKALDEAGLTISDVTPVYLPPADAATAFQSGQVDAWATWGNFFASAATSDGATVVATGADVDSHNDTVYVVNRAFLEEHPEAVEAVFDALSSATEAALDDPTILRKAWETDGLSPAVIDLFEEVPQATIEPVTAEVQEAWQQEADFWTEHGIIPDRIDVSEVTYTVG